MASINAIKADQAASSISDILSDQVSQTKLLASLILFVITLLCGYLPIRFLFNQNYIQYAMFAGGGVLMATAFCHLIPEAHDNYKLSTSGDGGELHHHHHHHAASELIPSIANLTTNLTNASNLIQTITTVPNSTTSSFQNERDHLDELLISSNSDSDSLFPSAKTINIPYLEVTLCCGFFFMYLVEQLMVRFINNHSHGHAACDTSIGQLVGETPSETQSNILPISGPGGDIISTSSTTNVNFTSAIINSPRRPSPRGTEFYKFMRGLLIVSAFGAHSIFDGVAIGSQVTVEKVWTIFLAISCHKLIIAAVVGLELYTATLESNLWTIVHLSIFSIMSPIGIILVVIAQESLHINSNHPAMILLQSFATGTLLYIVFVEILQPKENQAARFEGEKSKFGRSFSLIAGFALMLMVLTLIGDG